MNSLNVLFIIMLVGRTLTTPFNRPKFCANSSWRQHAAILTVKNINYTNFNDIFITTNDMIYVLDRGSQHIFVWYTTSLTPIRNITITSSNVLTIFVTENDDIYFNDRMLLFTAIRNITSNLTNFVSVTETYDGCYDIFIDNSNNIYCSIQYNHQVIRKSLNNPSGLTDIIAGTGTAGRTSYMLNHPRGIFVDTNFDLYVSDYDNGRIQLFRVGETDGITVAGNNSTITLVGPFGVVLDGNKYLFIVDHSQQHHRIIADGPNGFRCIIGCSTGVSSLYQPRSMSFDSFGNIFVVEPANGKVKKFTLLTNSCNVSTMSYKNNVTYFSSNSSNILTVRVPNGISYNRPKFDPYTVWNPNAITLANASLIGSNPYDIFINTNNIIYVPNSPEKRIQIWMNDTIYATISIDTDPINPNSIFVTTNGDIYTSNQQSKYEINRWILYSNNISVVMYADTECSGLFVDINNTLYCSVSTKHKVLAKSLYSASNILTVIAGTHGNLGVDSNSLYYPRGIFVDDNFDLYVADFGNHRIQRFRSRSLNGITMAGNESLNVTIILKNPTDIILDFEKNLFIVDNGNHRIVASGPHGFRCIVGCTGSHGLISNELFKPTSIAFDSFGNIYVVDQGNHRIQKFLRLNNSLSMILNPSYNRPKFCSNATWDKNATTVFGNSSLMKLPYALFIDSNNTIYTIDRNDGQMLIWLNNNLNPKVISHDRLSSSTSIFVKNQGDIYIATSNSVHLLAKSVSYSNISVPIVNVNSCMGIFIDISNSFYCSLDSQNQVLKKSLENTTSVLTRIAGNGSHGFASNMLHGPNGIFVDTNFDLYVADFGNNRIQLFRLGQSNGVTVAGKNSTTPTIELYLPSNVIMDGNKYLFISDSQNNRIIGSNQNGFRCIAGCSDSGSTSDKMNYPRAITFDSFGNLYVADSRNHRIQKFIFQINSCHQDVFLPPKCQDENHIGMNCSILSTPCNSLNPCGKHGNCINSITNIYGYECKYEENSQFCKLKPCWNSGTCNRTTNGTFECLCLPGWTGIYCEKKINYCEKVTCQNNGVCRSLLMNYSCECLGDHFSGRHCEKVAKKIVALRIVSKSVGYIAIIFLVCTVGFFVAMDVLKYCFGIDLTEKELKHIRQKKIKRRPVIQRFVYVNTPVKTKGNNAL